ncbi:hypothetical protein [Luteolibacter sp. Populi]|uniref:hypothetical protein n=1 Tax=Luteolibacter sp. Populi TaxID=3230487 RepID=UPI0034660E1C
MLPPGYPRIQLVNSFDELLTTPFAAGVNALCWPRQLPGDFAEVVGKLAAGEGITPLDEALLNGLPLSAAGKLAVAVMLEDLRLLREQGRLPELNCIRTYPRDEEPGVVATDVYSFHADSAPVEADTWLCTYHGAPSEGLRQEEARRRIDQPEIRAALLEEFGGEDSEEFREYLRDCCYDLHYAPLPEARPFSFGTGYLWRIAVDWPGSLVPPCIHRAPENLPGEAARLLLIS